MLHAAYASACVQSNRAPITKQMFGRLIKKYRPDLREFQRMVDGTKQWMYGGIGLTARGKNRRCARRLKRRVWSEHNGG